MERLRIGVDAKNLLNDRRGIGRYARALLRRWLNADAQDRADIVLLMPQFFLGPPKRRLSSIFQRDDLIVRHRTEASSLGLDAVWYPWNGMTWTAPLKSIATVHDVWPFASPSPDSRTRRNEQTPFRTTAAVADAIVTDSNFSKNEIVKHLGVAPERIHVVPLGVDPPPPAHTSSRLLLDGADRYVLFVGENEPRKGAGTLLEAMRALPNALRLTTGLVMVGKNVIRGPALGRIDAQTGRAGECVLRFQPDRSVPVLVTGEVSDERLGQLYANAAAFAFPSLYEGFGLPVLEAMVHGVPVVASDASSVPEAGGDAALYFPAGDAAVLSTQLTAVLSDGQLSQRLRAAGRERAAKMSWDECAKEMLHIIATMVQGP